MISLTARVRSKACHAFFRPLGEFALPTKGMGSWEATSSFLNCTRTMNQDGIALSQRHRSHLSWQ
jgi:hypothetical protein